LVGRPFPVIELFALMARVGPHDRETFRDGGRLNTIAGAEGAIRGKLESVRARAAFEQEATVPVLRHAQFEADAVQAAVSALARPERAAKKAVIREKDRFHERFG